MNHILVLGAGRSSSALITYLLQEAHHRGWQVTVGDYFEAAAVERISGHSNGKAVRFDINDEANSRIVISSADVVVSLMPPHLHIEVARHCLALNRHLLTASYVSEDMLAFHDEAKAKGLLFLNECGLDPGIDHMSAMQVIDKIKKHAGRIISFESFTGGLIAPETDPGNPWRYKFTWNPRNVVMAGQGIAKFLQDGQYRYIPYQQLFKRITPVSVDGIEYEGYANRDSLKYLNAYGLSGIETMLRGTLRNKGFCGAWDVLVQLGCCDDQFTMENVDKLTHSSFLDSFLNKHDGRSVEDKVTSQFMLDRDGEAMRRLQWSGFFSDEPIGITEGTPAKILEHILSKKWKLVQGDKDFIVMWHRFVYEQNGVQKEIHAYLTATGNTETDTAMARTVGLPLGIAACLLMERKISSRGVVIPVTRELYEPILQRLGQLGIALIEIGNLKLEI